MAGLTVQEKNLWRYTIGYYNTGTYISDAEKEIISNREQLKEKLGIKVDISDWSLTRMYIHNLCNEAITESQSKQQPSVCTHLAYTDHITGLENNINREGGSTGSLIQDWIKYKKNNTPIKCPGKLETPRI